MTCLSPACFHGAEAGVRHKLHLHNLDARLWSEALRKFRLGRYQHMVVVMKDAQLGDIIDLTVGSGRPIDFLENGRELLHNGRFIPDLACYKFWSFILIGRNPCLLSRDTILPWSSDPSTRETEEGIAETRRFLDVFTLLLL